MENFKGKFEEHYRDESTDELRTRTGDFTFSTTNLQQGLHDCRESSRTKFQLGRTDTDGRFPTLTRTMYNGVDSQVLRQKHKPRMQGLLDHSLNGVS